LEKLVRNNLSISIIFLVSIYLFQFLQVFFFREMYYILDYVFRALGGFLTLIAIPLIVAIIAKLVFKKQFFGVLWKSLLFISIPLCLLSAYGAYHESTQRRTYKSGITELTDPTKKTFHSFRHVVSDRLYKGLTEVQVIEQLQGRAGKTQTETRYSQGLYVRTIYEKAIIKLEYPTINWDMLKFNQTTLT
jgi:hypothetical protein